MKYTTSIMVFLGLISTNVFAQWEIVNDKSSINFVSIKKSNIGENHSFKNIKGKIDDAGAVEINIDLTSVETNIDIRNQRIKSMLFETSNFIKASVKGKVKLDKLNVLKVGDGYTDVITMTLSLHGSTNQIKNHVQVTKLNKNELHINSITPVLIKAENYSLSEGIERLRKIANLPSISGVVPVTFNLIFKEK